MSGARTFRKKPVEVQAVQFTGDNYDEVSAFTGRGYFGEVAVEDRADDPEIVAEVWDKLHGTWVGVKAGQWIICGVKGEFYPCDPEVLAATYDEVGGDG